MASGSRNPRNRPLSACATFHVDIVGADVWMTGEPEDVPALARVAMPQVEQHGYRAYPLIDALLHDGAWRIEPPDVNNALASQARGLVRRGHKAHLTAINQGFVNGGRSR